MYIFICITHAVTRTALTKIAVALFLLTRAFVCIFFPPPSLPQGELVDHTPHLLPAGQRSGEGEVVQWTPRPPGAIMAGVSLTVEGTRDFKVSDVIMT